MKSSPASVFGFTLTELMVVVAIAGILATVAVPGFKSLIQNQQVKNASFELYAALIVARSEAIKRNSDVTVTPVDYLVASPPPGHNENGWVIASGGVTIQNQSQLKGIVLTVAPSSSPWITYRRTGRTTAATTPVFTIDAYGGATQYARCIKIELSGMPHVYKAVNGVCS